MKITNSSINHYPTEASHSKKNLENIKEAIDKIQQTTNPLQDTPDTITLSDQAKKLLEAEQVVQDISSQLEAAADSKGSPYDELTKCLEIASRIMKGDKVPQADIQFLAEKQPELYSSAIFMKQNNENPKRHKSLLEDEKDNSIVVDSGKVELEEALANRIQPTEE